MSFLAWSIWVLTEKRTAKYHHWWVSTLYRIWIVHPWPFFSSSLHGLCIDTQGDPWSVHCHIIRHSAALELNAFDKLCVSLLIIVLGCVSKNHSMRLDIGGLYHHSIFETYFLDWLPLDFHELPPIVRAYLVF